MFEPPYLMMTTEQDHAEIAESGELALLTRSSRAASWGFPSGHSHRNFRAMGGKSAETFFDFFKLLDDGELCRPFSGGAPCRAAVPCHNGKVRRPYTPIWQDVRVPVRCAQPRGHGAPHAYAAGSGAVSVFSTVRSETRETDILSLTAILALISARVTGLIL